jgi:hypothetical protein
VVDHVISLAYVYPFRCEFCGHRFHALRWRQRYKKVPKDRRMHDRVEISTRLFVEARSKRVEAVTKTLSVGGCGLSTNAGLEVGDIVRLEIPCDESPIVIESAIVRSVRPGVAGIAFIRMQAGHAERLAALLADTPGARDVSRHSRRRFHPTRRPSRAALQWLATVGLTALCAVALATIAAGVAR